MERTAYEIIGGELKMLGDKQDGDQADASNTMPAPPVKPAQNQHKPAKAQAARQVTEP